MNCETAREKLIDVLYGELAAADKAAVMEHLSACPSCRQEWQRLLQARAGLTAWRAQGSIGVPPVSIAGVPPAAKRGMGVPPVGRGGSGDPPRETHTSRGGSPEPPRTAGGKLIARFAIGRHGPPSPLFWAWIPVAAAAAVVFLAIGLFLLPWLVNPPEVLGQGVEIEKTGVSLTILSEPANRPRYYQPEYQQYNGRGQMTSVNLPYRGWQGLALVRDQRLIRNLPKGQTQVKFTDVPTGILPDSVRLRSLDDPDGLTILEQNYQYDLASAEAIFKRYLDKPIGVLFKDGKGVSGDLLSFDGAVLVIRPPGQGPITIARDQVQAVRFEKLPEGLLSKPTLLWQLANRAAAKQQFEVAYMTNGLSWRADYVLKLHPAGGKAPAAQSRADLPEIIDTADLVGYATVTNNSGVTYDDAQLKLLAGDVNLVREDFAGAYIHSHGGASALFGGGADKGFEEKSFFEYHLYTLGRATTIRSAEVKQIELVSGSGLKLTRGYVYDRTANPTAARVTSEFANTEANGLGKPLPKGVVRLYAPDPEGQDAYISQMEIDHTPRDEKVRLLWGHAFDIACSAKQVGGGRDGDNYDQNWQYDLRNHKDADVTITVVVGVPASTIRAECTGGYRWRVKQVGLVEIEVPVKANSAAKVGFWFHYNNTSGGGLKSPFE